jgi:hypothetical protein
MQIWLSSLNNNPRNVVVQTNIVMARDVNHSGQKKYPGEALSSN